MTKPATVRDSLLRLAAEAPPNPYAYPRTYVVRAVNLDPITGQPTGRLDLDPPADAPELRSMDRVEQWTMGSVITIPAVGTEVLVAFRDARETRPVVVGIAPSAPGHAAARNGDEATRVAFYPGVPGTTPPSLWYSYQSGTGPFTWAPAALTIITGPVPTDPGTPLKITGGSDMVKVGP